jgi:hypothetical protein
VNVDAMTRVVDETTGVVGSLDRVSSGLQETSIASRTKMITIANKKIGLNVDLAG